MEHAEFVGTCGVRDTLAAILGPPLTGQSIPTVVELRHDVLMIDRELEGLTIQTKTPSDGILTSSRRA
jgi:hypothetical protein